MTKKILHHEQYQDVVKKLNIRHYQNFTEHVEIYVSQTIKVIRSVVN